MFARFDATPMKKVRIGVIGIGNIGSAHAANIFSGRIDNLVLSAVSEIDKSKCEWARQTFAGIHVFSDYKEMISSGCVDAVLIATQHYLHPEIAIYAFEKGIHVLSENRLRR